MAIVLSAADVERIKVRVRVYFHTGEIPGGYKP